MPQSQIASLLLFCARALLIIWNSPPALPTMPLMRRVLAVAFLLLAGSAPLPIKEVDFTNPIDALSVGVSNPAQQVEVSSWENGRWTDWHRLAAGGDEDTPATETSLLLFSYPTNRIRVRGDTAAYALHPIRISHDPVQYRIAATTTVTAPHILSRSEWGADESVTVGDRLTTAAELDAVTRSDQAPTRTFNCEQAKKNYPEEFAVTKTVATSPDGKFYKWPLQYSPAIRALVVHHTAAQMSGDTRSAVDRVRAIFQYHAQSLGWGDIGYNYVIDENGQVYEGRQGGDYVVGGHAYCASIGTVGIALLGNFEMEKPTADQMVSLQSLLIELGKKYQIDLSKSIQLHGEEIPPVVGHGEILSTRCPGYYVRGVLDTIRANVRQGKATADLPYPPPPPYAVTGGPDDVRLPRSVAIGTNGVFLYPSDRVMGKPGEIVDMEFRFRALGTALAQRAKIGPVVRSDNRIDVWSATDMAALHLSDALLLPRALQPNEEVPMHLRVQLPPDPGTYTLTVGAIRYTLSVEGAAVRISQTEKKRVQRALGKPLAPVVAAPVEEKSLVPFDGPGIRIRLVRNEQTFEKGTLMLGIPNATTVNSVTMTAGDLQLSKVEGDCRATRGDEEIARGVVRINPGAFTTKVKPFPKGENQFRGVLECRVLDDRLVLINELPLDDYLLGLGEEPDTQAYEKQRAFAVAARTYAAWYLDPSHPKFPGKPYHGSDSPAEFQKYLGATFEAKNPHWVRAVTTTANTVLKVGDKIIKPPFFSADAGRTLSPAEAGWKNFPFAEVFASKDDPWCVGQTPAGHGVGMSGCGATGQANDGRTAEQILQYYYPGTSLVQLVSKK